ncbi:hypothetical protein [Sphingomonas sp. HMP9]|uniref:hypothetical protein n=1 Tax=Sphingomonas sp. HMP9 TaxID=1517554 RepID=UPI001596D0D0|nr:hypothetical protein [Sphingomonas sp. HMP9]
MNRSDRANRSSGIGRTAHALSKPGAKPGSYSGSDWLAKLGEGAADDDAPVLRSVGDRLMPLRIAIIALISLVMLGPIMTNVEGGDGSVVRQIGYLAILVGTIFAIRLMKLPVGSALSAGASTEDSRLHIFDAMTRSPRAMISPLENAGLLAPSPKEVLTVLSNTV